MSITLAMLATLDEIALRERGARGQQRRSLPSLVCAFLVRERLIWWDTTGSPPALPRARLTPLGDTVLRAFRLGRKRWA